MQQSQQVLEFCWSITIVVLKMWRKIMRWKMVEPSLLSKDEMVISCLRINEKKDPTEKRCLDSFHLIGVIHYCNTND